MGRSSSTIRIFNGRPGITDINAPSRKNQDAQHSIVGHVNLGARIAPNASRKCQGDLFKPSRIYRGKGNLPRPAEEALILGVEPYLDWETRRRVFRPAANRLRFVQGFDSVFSSLTSPFDNYSLIGSMSKRGQETDYPRQEIVKRRYLFRLPGSISATNSGLGSKTRVCVSSNPCVGRGC